MSRAIVSRCAAFVLFVFAATSSYAQTGTKQDALHAQFNSFAKAMACPQAREVVTALQSTEPTVADGAEAMFTEYFGTILYPTLTQDKESLNWNKNRPLFKNKFFNAAANLPTLELLNRVTLNKMKEYATDNYNMIVRYNAMMFIAEQLNGTLLKPGVPVKPYTEALPVLLTVAIDAKMPAAVRDAAFIGLKRHSEAGIAEERKKVVVDAMLKIVNDKTPVLGASQDGTDWLRMRAAEVASVLGSAAPEVKALLSRPAISGPVPPGLPGIPTPMPVKAPGAPGADPF